MDKESKDLVIRLGLTAMIVGGLLAGKRIAKLTAAVCAAATTYLVWNIESTTEDGDTNA